MANYNSIHTGAAIDEAVTKTNDILIGNFDQIYYPGDDNLPDEFENIENTVPFTNGDYVLKLSIVSDSEAEPGSRSKAVFHWVYSN